MTLSPYLHWSVFHSFGKCNVCLVKSFHFVLISQNKTYVKKHRLYYFDDLNNLIK